ncbi:hypothetical protein BOX15_Mlig003741g1 [Macrostomum lignano]|nr:hypothetical protein BOX15_Mlig003741g2 [Macrostomum lignano]PAA62983.1 hypothetical protein BOX15_Mlig003741g1 [Macrostomum lignano]
MSAPEQPAQEVPRTELEEIQLLMNQKTDESLESTRRMVSMCEAAKEAGISTLVMLDDQGEQMDRIEEGMDQINTDMKDAEKNLDDLNKCCGLCILPWNKAGKGQFDKNFKKDDDGTVNTDGPRVVLGDNGMGPQGGYVTRITKDDREDEMDNNIQEVGNMVGNLRNMAIDMGSEITSQNRQLDRIQEKAASNQTRIEGANERANKMLK